mmetsp:Transcript_51275/g.122924  ORF Transcript_51275/g.122924 Transcript_51275/m.122924 type:complete len:296 (-) Transcript_51275:40-927(-)
MGAAGPRIEGGAPHDARGGALCQPRADLLGQLVRVTPPACEPPDHHPLLRGERRGFELTARRQLLALACQVTKLGVGQQVVDLLVVDLQEAELYVWLLLRLRIRRVLEDLAEAPGDSEGDARRFGAAGIPEDCVGLPGARLPVGEQTNVLLSQEASHDGPLDAAPNVRLPGGLSKDLVKEEGRAGTSKLLGDALLLHLQSRVLIRIGADANSNPDAVVALPQRRSQNLIKLLAYRFVSRQQRLHGVPGAPVDATKAQEALGRKPAADLTRQIPRAQNLPPSAGRHESWAKGRKCV